MKPEDKIVKIIDGQNTTIQATIVQKGATGALAVTNVNSLGTSSDLASESTLTTLSNTVASEATLSTLSSTAASESSLLLLRRIVKLLESNAVVDYANRQRIKLDALGGVEVTTTVPISGNIGGTVAVSGITAIGGNDPRYQFIDGARTSYAVMRQGLVFS